MPIWDCQIRKTGVILIGLPRTQKSPGYDELRRCIRDLVALSTPLPASRNHDMRQIGDSVVAALISMLDADFVSIVLSGRGNEPITETR